MQVLSNFHFISLNRIVTVIFNPCLVNSVSEDFACSFTVIYPASYTGCLNLSVCASVQFSSVVQLYPTLGDPMDCSTPGFPSITNSRSLPKLMSIELVMPSNHLILCPPLLLLPSIFPSIRVFSHESALHIRWPSIGVSASTSVLLMNTKD